MKNEETKNEEARPPTLAEELQAVIFRAGCRVVAEELGKIGEQLAAAPAGFVLPEGVETKPTPPETTGVWPSQLTAPKPGRAKAKKKKRKKKAGRLALPAPKASAEKKSATGQSSPVRDGIVEVLARADGPLTAGEIAERLRSRAFSYDPGVRADKQLAHRVGVCLSKNTHLFVWAGAHGMGYRLKR